MVICRGHQHYPVPQPNLFCPLTTRREEYLRRRRVRILLKEVVLYLPDIVKPQFVRQFYLRERVLEEFMFRAFVPRTGNLMFVK